MRNTGSSNVDRLWLIWFDLLPTAGYDTIFRDSLQLTLTRDMRQGLGRKYVNHL